MLFVLALCGFASAMSGRILDPVMTSIAGDFSAPITMVASLSSAYALPFAFCQPVLGPLGDMFPKVLIIKIAISLLAIFLILGAMAPTLSTLFGARILAGAGKAEARRGYCDGCCAIRVSRRRHCHRDRTDLLSLYVNRREGARSGDAGKRNRGSADSC